MSIIKEFLPYQINKIIEKLKVSIHTYEEFMEINPPEDRLYDIICAENKGFYDSYNDSIVINESFPDDILETTLHEIIHATGHFSRINREFFEKCLQRQSDIATEEITAYLGTFKLAKYFKFGTKLYGSKDITKNIYYLKADINKAEKDAEEASLYLTNLIGKI